MYIAHCILSRCRLWLQVEHPASALKLAGHCLAHICRARNVNKHVRQVLWPDEMMHASPRLHCHKLWKLPAAAAAAAAATAAVAKACH